MIQHLYLHVPFCHRVCPYCSFYKHTPGGTDMGAFVQALLTELSQHKQRLEIRPKTIYLGGGTPTALSTSHLSTLLDGLHNTLDLRCLEEFCLEINPKTINPAKAKMLLGHGVNRASVGVQAWDVPTLTLLGRDHLPDEAEKTYYELREAGFPSVSLDLMFSIPGQSLAVWREGLHRTLRLQPDHVSCYNLTYEEDTDFLRQLEHGAMDQDEDRDADHFYSAMDLLTGAGYEHYEISNYAKPGHRSRHNQSYWRGADYLGLGPSAVSTYQRTRWKNVPDTALYMQRVTEGILPASESETLSDSAWGIERIALELRTADGLPLSWLTPEQSPSLTMLRDEGLAFSVDDRLRLTRSGKAVADRIAEMLLPDD